MSKKVQKNLWLTTELASEFDEAVAQLSAALGDTLEMGEVGAAALLMFITATPTDQAKALSKARSHAAEKLVERLSGRSSERMGPTTTPKKGSGKGWGSRTFDEMDTDRDAVVSAVNEKLQGQTPAPRPPAKPEKEEKPKRRRHA